MKKLIIHLFAVSFLCVSCKKDTLDLNPPDKISSTNFWKSESDADLALAGAYSTFRTSPYTWGDWTVETFQPYTFDGFSDDSFSQFNYGGSKSAGSSGLTPLSGLKVSEMYNSVYGSIASINFLLANVDKVLKGDKLANYKSEGYFLRAFCYFWLAQLYGNVPIVKEDPYKIDPTSNRAKSTRDEVLAFVEQDLNAAIAGLPTGLYSTTGHPTKEAAYGYLARVLLFEKKYAAAAAAAKMVIDGGKYSLNPNYLSNFYKPDQGTSPEIMFSVQNTRTNAGNWNWLTDYTILQQWHGQLGTTDLIKEFEPADPRKTFNFFLPAVDNYYIVNKWVNPVTQGDAEYSDYVQLRYADVKLMYAEAQNEAVGPDASVYQQVNEVRNRTGVKMPPLAVALSQDSMRVHIRHERRVEFPMEGLRYFDLRRWGIATQKLNGFVSDPSQPTVKQMYKANYDFWPIPQQEIDRNQGVLKQNDGY